MSFGQYSVGSGILYSNVHVQIPHSALLPLNLPVIVTVKRFEKNLDIFCLKLILDMLAVLLGQVLHILVLSSIHFSVVCGFLILDRMIVRIVDNKFCFIVRIFRFYIYTI